MKIGITSTIPSEIVLAAGHTLVDLNNIFVSSPQPRGMVAAAENDGYPSSCCGWIRGIYGTVRQLSPVDEILSVTGGDCSNTHAMAETFELHGFRPVSFSYPLNKSRAELLGSMESLCRHFRVTLQDAERVREELEPLRCKLEELDEAFSQGRISFDDYHLVALSSSDYNSNLIEYRKRVDEILDRVRGTESRESGPRVALLGVPPIISDLGEVLTESGLQVVFDEIPRQFCMPKRDGSIVDQYLSYTYPYGMLGRIPDIVTQCRLRKVQAVIHYTQSFCFRAIEDVILRKYIKLPVLTIEGDEPGRSDERLKLRIESFAEMLRGI